jgi:hypothetical protein
VNREMFPKLPVRLDKSGRVNWGEVIPQTTAIRQRVSSMDFECFIIG